MGGKGANIRWRVDRCFSSKKIRLDIQVLPILAHEDIYPCFFCLAPFYFGYSDFLSVVSVPIPTDPNKFHDLLVKLCYFRGPYGARQVRKLKGSQAFYRTNLRD